MDISELVGKTLSRVVVNENDHGDRAEILFFCDDGDVYQLAHEQDCCETVYIDDICGDIQDLVGDKISVACCASQQGASTDWGTQTWTFYNLATTKGYVTIRWIGESSGYYSEEVDFYKINTGRKDD